MDAAKNVLKMASNEMIADNAGSNIVEMFRPYRWYIISGLGISLVLIMVELFSRTVAKTYICYRVGAQSFIEPYDNVEAFALNKRKKSSRTCSKKDKTVKFAGNDSGALVTTAKTRIVRKTTSEEVEADKKLNFSLKKRSSLNATTTSSNNKDSIQCPQKEEPLQKIIIEDGPRKKESPSPIVSEVHRPSSSDTKSQSSNSFTDESNSIILDNDKTESLSEIQSRHVVEVTRIHHVRSDTPVFRAKSIGSFVPQRRYSSLIHCRPNVNSERSYPRTVMYCPPSDETISCENNVESIAQPIIVQPRPKDGKFKKFCRGLRKLFSCRSQQNDEDCLLY